MEQNSSIITALVYGKMNEVATRKEGGSRRWKALFKEKKHIM
jgi:hypothetical protein